MHTLSIAALQEKLGASTRVQELCRAFGDGRFPLEIEACEGAFAGLLLARFAGETAPGGAGGAAGPFLAVTPTEAEAARLACDAAAAGLAVTVFPWWGTIPYREAAPNAAVFGERAACLAALLRGGAERAKGPPRLFIACECAFLGTLPPPAYFDSLLTTLRTGDACDPQALSEKLVLAGYLRVPRVQAPGEFTLRGEVCDLLQAGGGGLACRVLLDFDRIESIRTFDPLNQISQEKVDEITIYPMKEVVWTDDRIDALSETLAHCDEFSEGGGRVLESLINRKSMPGEELFFPLAFGGVDGGRWTVDGSEARDEKTAPAPRAPSPKSQVPSPNRHQAPPMPPLKAPASRPHSPLPTPYSLLDYLPPQGVVFFFDRERLDNAQDLIERDYKKAYAQARREKEVPAPQRLLLNLPSLAAERPRRVSFMGMKGPAREGALRLSAGCEPARSFFGNINYMREEFTALLAEGWDIAAAAESDAQALRIRTLLESDTFSPQGGGGGFRGQRPLGGGGGAQRSAPQGGGSPPHTDVRAL
ncbi:MAG: hypothetical protein LBR16_02595 [Treponema sp.]|jgi:transcription-repair coupling factor (superfamily II helicase)|nr:hypothetical protein [Treponema sp.]